MSQHSSQVYRLTGTILCNMACVPSLCAWGRWCALRRAAAGSWGAGPTAPSCHGRQSALRGPSPGPYPSAPHVRLLPAPQSLQGPPAAEVHSAGGCAEACAHVADPAHEGPPGHGGQCLLDLHWPSRLGPRVHGCDCSPCQQACPLGQPQCALHAFRLSVALSFSLSGGWVSGSSLMIHNIHRSPAGTLWKY